MELIRTTVRLDANLKKAAEMTALKQNTTFQAILAQALELYLRQESQRTAKKIVFMSQDIGLPLDNLTREDIYAD